MDGTVLLYDEWNEADSVLFWEDAGDVWTFDARCRTLEWYWLHPGEEE